jgi:hypothetical protein
VNEVFLLSWPAGCSREEVRGLRDGMTKR